MSVDLNRFVIPTPCPANWEEMRGDGVVRFCDQCQLHVHDFSAMSRKEAEDILARNQGQHVCGRVSRDADGAVITTERPTMLQAITRRSVLAYGSMMCWAVAAMAGQGEGSKLTGVVTDASGAVIPNANVSWKRGSEGATTTTNETGRYEFLALAPGQYEVRISFRGFREFQEKVVLLPNVASKTLDATLQVGSVGETVEIAPAANTPPKPKRRRFLGIFPR